MSRKVTARLVVLFGVASWLFVLYGCQSEAPAPIEGKVETMGKDQTTAKPTGAMQPTLDPNGK